MHLNLLNIFLFLGIIQGTIISLISIGTKEKTSLSNKVFCGIIAILTVATLGTFLGSSLDISLFSVNQKLFFVYFPYHVMMPLGPLILFYCRSLFDKEFHLNKKYNAHFIPVVFDIIPFLLSLTAFAFYNLGYLPVESPNRLFIFLNDYNTYVDIPRFLSLSIYLFFSWKYMLMIKGASDIKTSKWCKEFLTGMSIITIIWLPYLLIYISPFQPFLLRFFYYFPIYLPIVGFIYFLSIKLMSQNLPLRKNEYSVSELTEKANYLKKIIEEEKLYLIPGLKVNLLKDKTGISEKTISFILNHHLKKGFNDFINEYRINEAINMIQNRNLEKYTLEGLALDVGFSSRSTFNRAFKKTTGKLPSDYINL